MFKAFMLYALQKTLGKIFDGISAEALNISVWKGEIVLKDLRVKDEALSSVNLPVTVKACFIGTMAVQFPWKSFGTEPISYLVDRIFILAEPSPDGHILKDKDIKEIFESNFEHTSTLDGGSWNERFVEAINRHCCKFTISNVRISYEDSINDPSFVAGVCKNNQRTEDQAETQPNRVVRVGSHGSWFGSGSTKLRTE